MKLNGYIGSLGDREGYLFRDGKTDYRILIPAQASEAEIFAAQELTDIFAMAGVTIETITDQGVTPDASASFIAVGNTVYFQSLNQKLTQKEFKFDGFIIETIGNTYVIKGVGDTGTCMGVYGFAEYAMGYRYYAEDEVVVAKEGRNKEFHIRDIPTFFGRNAYSHDTQYHPDHSFRLRINGEFSLREKKHGEGIPWSTLHDQSNAIQIMDFTKYRPEHPEWFYVRPENYYGKPPRSNPQICFSRAMLPDAEGGFHDTFMKNLIENYIIPEKDKMFFMLGMSDTHDFCPCDLCQKAVDKYTRSGLSMRFTNMVADEVEAWRKENAPEREIYMVSFAYHTTFEAPVIKQGDTYIPVDESVVGRDNVIIQYAPIKANYLYDLMDPVHNADSRESLLGWSVVAKHLFVWDYRQDFRDIVFPFPSARSAQANHEIYMKMGVMEIFNQAQRFCPGSPFIDMDNFARARMHWNGKENYDELTDEFRRVYYKEAEPYVTEYFHALGRFWDALEQRGYTGDPHWVITRRPDYNRKEELDEFREILDKALAAANTISDPVIRQKVWDRVNVLTFYYKFTWIASFPFEKPMEEMLEIVSDLREMSKKYGLKYFHMWRFTSDYLDDFENIIRRKITDDQRKYPLFT